MGFLHEFKRSLAETLTLRIPSADFAIDESDRILYQQLERPLVCLSFEKLSLGEAALGGLVADSLGRRAEVSVKLSIFSNEPDGSQGCVEIFDLVCESLLFAEGNSLREIRCGETDYILKREAYRLDAVLKYGLLLVREGGGTEVVSGFHLLAHPVSSFPSSIHDISGKEN